MTTEWDILALSATFTSLRKEGLVSGHSFRELSTHHGREGSGSRLFVHTLANHEYRQNRKQCWAVAWKLTLSDLGLPVLYPEVSTTSHHSTTSWGPCVHTHEPVADVSHSNPKNSYKAHQARMTMSTFPHLALCWLQTAKCSKSL